jgi:glycosyltransferase involved in cell wall biosynthesis
MNKGRLLARGRWLLFLGADDRLDTPEVLARARAGIGDATGRVCCGEAVYDDGRVWRPGHRHIRRSFVHHQACFYHHSLLAATAYDEGLRFQADYDLNLRLWRAGVPFVPLALRVSRCGTGGLSDGGRWANYREEITVRHRHFPAWRCWPWDAGSVVRYGRKKIIRSRASTRPE